MSNKIAIFGCLDFQSKLTRVLFAAEQHFDYMRRSISSESGRYTVDEHDQLWGDILDMRELISKMGKAQ